MSFSQPQPAMPEPAAAPVLEPQERVGLGLLAASAAVIGGVALTVVIWRAGYIAAITSLVIAFGAAYLYEMAAGRSPRKGLVPLLVLIVVGVVVSFFSIVASDAWDAYDEIGVQAATGMGRFEFIRRAMVEPEILQEYGKDTALFIVLAIVGIIGVGRRMFGAR